MPSHIFHEHFFSKFGTIYQNIFYFIFKINNKQMNSFNIDFLTNHMVKKKPQRPKQQTIGILFEKVRAFLKGQNNKRKRSAFMNIFIAKKQIVPELSIVSKKVKWLMAESFFNIRRFALLIRKKDKINVGSQMNYPISLLTRLFQAKKLEICKHSVNKIIKYQRFLASIEQKYKAIPKLLYNIQKRAFLRQLYDLQKKQIKYHGVYAQYSKDLFTLLQRVMLRGKRQIFVQLIINLEINNMFFYQRQKNAKSAASVRQGRQKNQSTAELKRKIFSLNAQVNENKAINTKKKVDGAKQNAVKLTRKNEELMAIENNIQQNIFDNERFQGEIQRKQNIVKAKKIKSNQEHTFQSIKKLYIDLQYMGSIGEDSIKKENLLKLINKKSLQNFVTKNLNFVIAENIQLKYHINLYESLENPRKTEIYLAIDNENTFMKLLVNSLIKFMFMDNTTRQKLSSNVEIINFNFKEYGKEMSKLKKGK